MVRKFLPWLSSRPKRWVHLRHVPLHQTAPLMMAVFLIFSVRSTEFRSQEKVGGDLVDALTLANGDTVGYVADIAGHGLAAGLMMGMLKTATRTALRDRSGGEGTELVSDR